MGGVNIRRPLHQLLTGIEAQRINPNVFYAQGINVGDRGFFAR